MTFRTWHAECAVAFLCLALTASLSGGSWVEWIGAAAVFCGFGHAQIAERLREQEAQRQTSSVVCHQQLGHYFLLREILWTVYFVSLGAWSALMGCVIFGVYPLWRRFWRRRHPLKV